MAEQGCVWKVLLLVALLSSCHGARILGIIPMPAKSHNIVFLSLMRELATRQHQVTVLTFFPQEVPQPNYTDISLNAEIIAHMRRNDMFAMNEMSSFQKLIMLWVFGNKFSDTLLQQPTVQQLIHSKDQQFDLVIIESFFNEAFLGFAHKFNAPIIAVCPFGGIHWMGHAVGNPSPFSHVPDTFLNYEDRMTFTQRLHNTIVGVFGLVGHALYYMPQQDAIMRKYFNDSGPLPSLWELEKKTALFLANAHISLSYPKPLVPNMVYVGGMHIKPPKKLPQDLQKYLDDAPDGVIYFSMGSALQSAQMPEAKRKALIDIFSKLKQKVLWKWEEDKLQGQPPNLQTGKWFPQADILAHPNIKFFITHGGLLSTQEAIYHGVPLIGIPVFGDQQLNMARAESAGYGIAIGYSNLTTESLQWAIEKMLHQPSYRENARRLSKLFKDQPQTPMETAVYWTEYIIRHKGAPHLRSAALDLAWHQYFLLDVIAVVLGAVLFSLLLVYLCLKAVFRMLTAKSNKKQQVPKGKSKKKN